MTDYFTKDILNDGIITNTCTIIFIIERYENNMSLFQLLTESYMGFPCTFHIDLLTLWYLDLVLTFYFLIIL